MGLFGNSQKTTVTNPDPSTLTIETIRHEIDVFGKQMDARLIGMEKERNARLDAIDIASKLLNDNFTRVPTDVDKAIKCLDDLLQEKIVRLEDVTEEQFKNVEKQFKERDERVAQSATQVKLAVDAALQAQKEAVREQNKSNTLAIDKSEKNTKEQIDGIKALINTQNAAIDARITEIKNQQLRTDSATSGGVDARASQHSTIIMLIAGVSVLLAIGSAILPHLIVK